MNSSPTNAPLSPRISSIAPPVNIVRPRVRAVHNAVEMQTAPRWTMPLPRLPAYDDVFPQRGFGHATGMPVMQAGPVVFPATATGLSDHFQNIGLFAGIRPPSYWATSSNDQHFPPGPDDGLPEPRRENASLRMGDLAPSALERNLSGASRDRAITHRNNIDIKLEALEQIAISVRTCINAGASPVDFLPLANSLIELRNAWARGDLLDSSRHIRAPLSAANTQRTALEDAVKALTDDLARQIHANVDPTYHLHLLSAVGNLKRMKL